MDDGHGWAASVKDYIDFVHACKPADPDAPVLIPGDPERQRAADRRANGLPLPGEAWESILAAGENLGLDRDALAEAALIAQ